MLNSIIHLAITFAGLFAAAMLLQMIFREDSIMAKVAEIVQTVMIFAVIGALLHWAIGLFI